VFWGMFRLPMKKQMQSFAGFWTKIRSKNTGIAALLLAAIIVATSAPVAPSTQEKSVFSPILSFTSSGELPQLLSEADKNLYVQIYLAQKAAKWEEADALITSLNNKMLLGHALAERYTSRRYTPTATELTTWLENYSDHSQAYDIYTMATKREPALATRIEAPERSARLRGYGDGDSTSVRFDDNPQAKVLWDAGLSAWRQGDKVSAAIHFTALADGKENQLSQWQLSAANFWAYRAHSATGDTKTASAFLERAAEDSRSFYGILAHKQLKRPLSLDRRETPLSSSDIATIMADSEAVRAVALAQIGLTERADSLLRNRFPEASKSEKWILLKLARELDLASVQISMANQLESDAAPLDFAKYPIPHWEPVGGFNLEPALIYALMRQESGFRASAIGPGGSLGLMQLMPQTASMMKRRGTGSADSASEPVQNITLGERYVSHLLENELVRGNLFYMLAAYNAGPGKLARWQEEIGYNNDPLLFVESIPYSVTRYYVMQVMTNYWIYSELAGTPCPSVFALLKGNWPVYPHKALPLADARP
jgi:soluble lytic murein transglycosylase